MMRWMLAGAGAGAGAAGVSACQVSAGSLLPWTWDLRR